MELKEVALLKYIYQLVSRCVVLSMAYVLTYNTHLWELHWRDAT